MNQEMPNEEKPKKRVRSGKKKKEVKESEEQTTTPQTRTYETRSKKPKKSDVIKESKKTEVNKEGKKTDVNKESKKTDVNKKLTKQSEDTVKKSLAEYTTTGKILQSIKKPLNRIVFPDEEEDEEYEEGEEEIDLDDLEDLDELIDVDDELVLLEKENPELYEKFLEIRDFLVAEIPKIDVLLKTPMHIKDKARIIELFEMFCVCEPLTFEWIELKNQIKQMTEKAVAKYNSDQKLDTEIRKKIDQELDELKQMTDIREDSFEHKIVLLNLPLEFKNILYKRYQILQMTNPHSDEVGKLTDWLSTVIKVPFGVQLSIPGENVLAVLKDKLDSEFYGMNQVKEQILIYVSNKLYNPNIRKYPLGLIGPPGTAKTSIALAISQALNFPFEQLSGGGLVHTDGIHGHAYTYTGSQAGDIVKAMIRMKCMNGILFIDEFDKLPLEKNLNSILQLIDPVQNHNFKDNYIGDIPIDLSNIWYILSMNDIPPNQALKDRIYLVHISGYTENEKFQILKNNTIPKLLEQYKLQIELEDEVLYYIIRNSEGEGMRQCIHILTDILSKLVFIQQHPDIHLSFTTPIPSDRKITLDYVSKLIKSSHTKTFNSMYI